MTAVLAATLGALVYFVSTSLPYFAISPSTDPVWGPVNACLLSAAPVGRVGFAVRADAQGAATWTERELISCGPTAHGPQPTRWVRSGVTRAAFDLQGRLWAANDGHLALYDGPEPRDMAELKPVELVGTSHGVVVLEQPARLLAVSAGGDVTGLVDLGELGPAHLAASGDGARISLTAAGGVFFFDSERLKRLRAEAPCAVEYLWWLPAGHRALVACGPHSSWALELDADAPTSETASARRLSPSTLAGSGFVEPCDSLPCSARPPG
jgi:hypothetical protein